MISLQEFQDADIDGKIAMFYRERRWEEGFRGIVTNLCGVSVGFEIPEVFQEIKERIG